MADEPGTSGLVAQEAWLAVGRGDRVCAAGVTAVRVAAVDLLLVANAGGIVACERACPHEQADLLLGHVQDGRLWCPHHAASFCLADGSVSPGWPSRPLRLYPVRIERGEILIEAAALKSSERCG